MSPTHEEPCDHEKRKASPTMTNPTSVERTSERDIVVRRTFDAPAHIVFEAWTNPELLKRWWCRPRRG